MAVPAAASGRTKGSGRLAGAGLGSKRSPKRGAGASRKSRSGPRSRHLRCLSRRGSSRPARRRRRYHLTPGTPRPAPVRSASSGTSSVPAGPEPSSGSPPPRRSPSPTRRWALPAAGKACPARLGVRLLPEHLRPIRRTRPGSRLRSESETPEIGYFRKRFGSLRPTAARRSVISVAARPLLRGREKSWA